MQHLRDKPFAQLQSAAEHVREMLAGPGWAAVQELVAVERERLVARMTNPSLPSYEDMAATSGEIRGLTSALAMADRVLKVAEERDHELERLAAAGQEV